MSLRGYILTGHQRAEVPGVWGRDMSTARGMRVGQRAVIVAIALSFALAVLSFISEMVYIEVWYGLGLVASLASVVFSKKHRRLALAGAVNACI